MFFSGSFSQTVAASGEEALAACAERLPDLVLLDVEMPGMDGHETCGRLRQARAVPIIYATNSRMGTSRPSTPLATTS